MASTSPTIAVSVIGVGYLVGTAVESQITVSDNDLEIGEISSISLIDRDTKCEVVEFTTDGERDLAFSSDCNKYYRLITLKNRTVLRCAPNECQGFIKLAVLGIKGSQMLKLAHVYRLRNPADSPE